MAGKVTLVDVSTARFQTDVEEMIVVGDLLDQAGVDLGDAAEFTLRDVATGKELSLEDEVPVGAVVLLTRNIAGG